MTRKTSHRSILQSIASAFGSGQQSAAQTLDAALDSLLQEVACARISLWRFERREATRGLRCFAAKLAGQPVVEDDTLLAEQEYRDYYAALVEHSVFVCDDASHDPRLQAMRGSYLLKHRITALLDIAVTINGRAYGIVCCEQIGAPRPWTPRQVRAAREAVRHAGLLLAREPSIRLEHFEAMPIEPF